MRLFPDCIVCSMAGNLLYEGLTDRLLPTQGRFNLKQCPSCGMFWLDPMPEETDIPAYYENYFIPKDSCGRINAHQEKRPWAGLRDFLRENIIFGYYGYHRQARKKIYAFLGALLGCIPLLRSMANYSINGYLPRKHSDPEALLIDVGCGRGDYLKNLRSLGWNVMGIELDPVAAEMAKKEGIPVFCGTLEGAQVPSVSADYITMRHVIEHVRDPGALIKECLRVLKKDGRLIIHTPNGDSLGRKIFKQYLYSFDPPRHLFIFTPKSIRQFLEQCAITEMSIKIVSRTSATIYDNSILIVKQGKTDIAGVKPQRGRLGFVFWESFLCSLGFARGEELEVIVRKT